MSKQIAYVEIDLNTWKCSVAAACGLKAFDNYLAAKTWLGEREYSYTSDIPSSNGRHKMTKVFTRYFEIEPEA